MQKAKVAAKSCLLCSSQRFYSWGSWEYGGVTSDSRPWPLPFLPVLCLDCGHVQYGCGHLKWEHVCAEIYAGYQVHFSSSGSTQLLFSPAGVASPRDVESIRGLMRSLPDSRTGRLLDFGCGNGSYLKHFNELFPSWELYGLDRAAHFKSIVLGIPAVSAFYENLDEAQRMAKQCGGFDLITLNHVLEHLSSPVTTLKQLGELLAPNGRLFARVPDFSTYPFDLLIVDHCSHFSQSSLAILQKMAGLSPIHPGVRHLDKEMGFLAERAQSHQSWKHTVVVESAKHLFDRSLGWLHSLPKYFSEQSAAFDTVAILGCAIAGVWLAETMKGIDFFVEEDPNRYGTSPQGLPIHPRTELVPGTAVLLPFPPKIAQTIKNRLAPHLSSCMLICPPEFV